MHGERACGRVRVRMGACMGARGHGRVRVYACVGARACVCMGAHGCACVRVWVHGWVRVGACVRGCVCAYVYAYMRDPPPQKFLTSVFAFQEMGLVLWNYPRNFNL